MLSKGRGYTRREIDQNTRTRKAIGWHGWRLFWIFNLVTVHATCEIVGHDVIPLLWLPALPLADSDSTRVPLPCPHLLSNASGRLTLIRSRRTRLFLWVLGVTWLSQNLNTYPNRKTSVYNMFVLPFHPLHSPIYQKTPSMCIQVWQLPLRSRQIPLSFLPVCVSGKQTLGRQQARHGSANLADDDDDFEDEVERRRKRVQDSSTLASRRSISFVFQQTVSRPSSRVAY